jgi:arylformamidase
VSKIIDITPPISRDLAVWPGDVPFNHEISLCTNDGDHMTLSAIRGTVHLGAHTDAPNHYRANGESIESRDLDLYYGPCVVVDARVKRGERITPAHLSVMPQSPRVLFRTGTYRDPNAWNDDFASLSPELVHALAANGVRLVGIDTPSIDPMHDKDLLSHHAVADHDMAILEGIVLEHVTPGNYQLIALPLPLVGADASPVRAVLIAP